MQKISQRGISLLRKFEGLSLYPYNCPAGKRTIGYGHVILPSETHLLNSISANEAELLLRADIEPIESAFKNILRCKLTQNQFDALGCLVFNIGIQAFQHSSLLRLLNLGKTEQAGKQFGRWIYTKGKPLNGLIKRRAEELKLFTE
jgi:lysozyme